MVVRESDRRTSTPPLAGDYLPGPVETITGVWRFVREPRGYGTARSLPGHLLHLLVQGAYDLRTNGRAYHVQAGDVIYYHETEEVEWLGNDVTVVFYSVGFLAPELPPLSLERRVFPSGPAMRQAFECLVAAAAEPSGLGRTCRMFAALYAILNETHELPSGLAVGTGRRGDRWRDVEAALRRDRRFRATLDELCALCHCSRATLVRFCRMATGTSPMRRLRTMRMEEARGLLAFSTLSITEIAEYLGYPRVHEFSREFSRYWKHPPRAFRNG